MSDAARVAPTTSVPAALVAGVLLLCGVWQGAEAYGGWGSWPMAVLLLAAGAVGFAWVARGVAREGGRVPGWLLLWGSVVVIAAVFLALAGAACNGGTGFSCGG